MHATCFMRTAAAALVAAAVGACGSGTTGPVTGAGGGGPGGTAPAAAGGGTSPTPNSGAGVASGFTGTAVFSGGVPVNGQFQSAAAPLPCTTLGQTGSSGRFPLPSPGRVAGTEVQISMAISPYTGPGQYGKDRIQPTGDAVRVAGRSYGLEGAGASATINPDGSGRLQLSNLQAGSGQPLSGEIRWTCHAIQVGAAPSAQPSAQP
jgi:hypothetical protein